MADSVLRVSRQKAVLLLRHLRLDSFVNKVEGQGSGCLPVKTKVDIWEGAALEGGAGALPLLGPRLHPHLELIVDLDDLVGESGQWGGWAAPFRERGQRLKL